MTLLRTLVNFVVTGILFVALIKFTALIWDKFGVAKLVVRNPVEVELPLLDGISFPEYWSKYSTFLVIFGTLLLITVLFVTCIKLSLQNMANESQQER